MPTNEFNTGRDCSLVITHPLAPGGRLDLSLVEDFDAKPNYHDITANHLDGFTRTQHIPQNHALSFSLDRSTSLVDDFCSALESTYRLRGRMPDGKVYHYVTEIDGSTTTTEFNGVAFKVDALGTWKKDDKVMQKVMGTAMERKRV